MNVKPVWISKGQRDALEYCDEGARYQNVIKDVVRAWDAAPGSPQEAIEVVRAAITGLVNKDQEQELIIAVLVALGYPGVKS